MSQSYQTGSSSSLLSSGANHNQRWVAFAFSLVFPVMALVFVPVLRNLAHGQPGGWVGFRTLASTSSVENWQLAQTMSANHFLVIGLVSLAVTLLVFATLRLTGNFTRKWSWRVATVLITLEIAAMLASIVIIDRALPRVAVVQAPLTSAGQIAMPVLFGLLIPVLLVLMGPFSRRIANRSANWAAGYRTPASTSSPENWRLANTLFGDISQRSGLVCLGLAALVFLAMYFAGNFTLNAWWMASLIMVCASMIPMVAAIPIIERRLKANMTNTAGRND